MVLHGCLLALMTWLLPFCLGLMPVRFMKNEHKSLGMIWVSGWFVMFASFQLMCIPFIVAEASFSLVVICYTVLILLLACLSVFVGHRAAYECLEKIPEKMMEKGHKLLMACVILLIVGQLAGAIIMQYLDGDDSFFVATSLTSQYTDTMYRFTPYYGANGTLDLRHALSPVPIFMAWLSGICGMHVTIVCHVYIATLFLVLMYVIYAQMAKQLFPSQRKNQWLFLLFLTIWYLFGNVSIYTAESFAYTRTWQGKAMFPNLLVPAVFLWLLYVAKDEMDVGEWSMLFILTLCTAFTTSTGIFTVPILMGIAAILLAIHKRNVKLPLQIFACLVPSVFYGMLYLFLR